MKQRLALAVGLVAVLGSWTAATAKQNSDFALLNGPGDTSVQCGAKRGNGPGSFVYYVTMSNVAAVPGAIRVTYTDGDTVDYLVPAGGSFSFSQAAGGTKNVDDLITVSAVDGAVLVGSMSALVDPGAQPHPALAPNYCTTTN